MTAKQAPVSACTARVNSISIVAQLMLKVFPDMTTREENWKILTEITKEVAEIANENMSNRHSGHPDAEDLFELTGVVITQLAAQLVSPKFGGERRYCKWASDTFIKVLDRNGATTAVATRQQKGAESAGGGDDSTKATEVAEVSVN
jgi:hypothetical protein